MKLLDLFCGAGGAAMGYHRAGFKDITGIDNRSMPRYPFKFIQADALKYLEQHGHEYDVIHASPPCQAYSQATAWRGNRKDHPALIHIVRNKLLQIGKPYIIENVSGGRNHLINALKLCGTILGLPIQRHRFFEVYPYIVKLLPSCKHSKFDYSFDHGGKQKESIYRDAMGVEWMTVLESRQAIPPAYTEWIGKRIMENLTKGS